MALKAATTVIPADGIYTYTVVQATPKRDGMGPSAGHKTTPEGVPLWTVDALRSGPEGADLIAVTIASPTQPEVTGPAVFAGLRAGLWLGDRGKQGGIYWHADGVSPAAAQSSRRGE